MEKAYQLQALEIYINGKLRTLCRRRDQFTLLDIWRWRQVLRSRFRGNQLAFTLLGTGILVLLRLAACGAG